MTTVLDSSMTAEEIQAKIDEVRKKQEVMSSKKLEELREARRKIKKEFLKTPLSLERSPLEIQRESRDD